MRSRNGSHQSDWTLERFPRRGQFDEQRWTGRAVASIGVSHSIDGLDRQRACCDCTRATSRTCRSGGDRSRQRNRSCRSSIGFAKPASRQACADTPLCGTTAVRPGGGMWGYFEKWASEKAKSQTVNHAVHVAGRAAVFGSFSIPHFALHTRFPPRCPSHSRPSAPCFGQRALKPSWTAPLSLLRSSYALISTGFIATGLVPVVERLTTTVDLGHP